MEEVNQYMMLVLLAMIASNTAHNSLSGLLFAVIALSSCIMLAVCTFQGKKK